MADMDWKKLISGIAPVLGTALGGPLAGEAVSMLGQALGLGTAATPSDIATAVGSGQLTGDQIVAMKQAENDFTEKMKAMDIDVLKINAAADQALIADTSDARHQFSGNENVFVLGVCILVGFAILMGLVLTGCFWMMTNKVLVDQSMVAVCASLVGTVVGYVAANAQQVVSFFYGSSKGSKDNGDRIGAALTETLRQSAISKQ